MTKKQKWYEKEKHGAFWEKGYADKKVSTMGGPSLEVLEVSGVLPSKARVLDLGCGEGRNSLFLAQQGCEVTAIDQSESAIDKINLITDKLGIDIDARIGDLNSIVIDDNYDLVMAHGVLHFLAYETWQSLLSTIKEKTNPNGFNIFSIFVFNEDYLLLDEIRSAGYKSSFTHNELKEFYSDWENIRYDNYVKWDQHPGIPIHAHPVEKIVSRKNLNKDKYGNDYNIKSLYNNEKSISEKQFKKIEIGVTEDVVLEKFGKPIIKNEVDFGKDIMGARNYLESSYILKDLFYGKFSFQFINNELRGKYLYYSSPIRVIFNI